MATALKPEFVIITDCELSGNTPSDHDVASSHLPLAGFVQDFVCAEAKVEVNVIADATRYIVRPIFAFR